MSVIRKTRIKPKYRVCLWHDLKRKGDTFYGIQTQRAPRQKWLHCFVDKVALIYKKRETADKIIRWLNDPNGTEPEWNDDAAIKKESQP